METVVQRKDLFKLVHPILEDIIEDLPYLSGSSHTHIKVLEELLTKFRKIYIYYRLEKRPEMFQIFTLGIGKLIINKSFVIAIDESTELVKQKISTEMFYKVFILILEAMHKSWIASEEKYNTELYDEVDHIYNMLTFDGVHGEPIVINDNEILDNLISEIRVVNITDYTTVFLNKLCHESMIAESFENHFKDENLLPNNNNNINVISISRGIPDSGKTTLDYMKNLNISGYVFCGVNIPNDVDPIPMDFTGLVLYGSDDAYGHVEVLNRINIMYKCNLMSTVYTTMLTDKDAVEHSLRILNNVLDNVRKDTSIYPLLEYSQTMVFNNATLEKYVIMNTINSSTRLKFIDSTKNEEFYSICKSWNLYSDTDLFLKNEYLFLNNSYDNYPCAGEFNKFMDIVLRYIAGLFTYKKI